ncbi:MAG: 50S ribosomal protein L11 methyltransferase [Alphaproteobacteria bacterium]|nr:50S ribosomal protein L11 methyltransferase [Alphaproteobacteria bacterium]
MVAPPGDGTRFAEAFEELFPVVWLASDEETGPDGAATVVADRVCGYAVEPPDGNALRASLARVGQGVRVPDFEIMALPDIDWVAESQKGFVPVCVGRFVIHGRAKRPADRPGRDIAQGCRLAATRPIAVEIAANIAFGTGTHGSTKGCLLALDRLACRRSLPPGPVLDLGCGTGILAIAAAKSLGVTVVASDVDPVAVEIAARNAAANGVGRSVRPVRGSGYDTATVRRCAPYALILANLTAAPLARMAHDLNRHLADGGVAIVSGLLAGQERQVLIAHLTQGLRLEARVNRDGWSTLTLRKRGGKHAPKKCS